MLYKSEHADLLCTIITCGFIQLQKEKGHRTRFTYPPEDIVKNEEEIKKLTGLLKRVNVELEIVESIPQNKFPFIVAQDSKAVMNPSGINVNQTALMLLHQNCKEDPPKEAYIGGVSKSGGNMVVLYRPSTLYKANYNPQFDHIREKDRDEFDSMNKEIVKANLFLNKFRGNPSLVIQDESEENPKEKEARLTNFSDLESKKLFGSVHGMVYAMNKLYGSGSDDWPIELAMGCETTKVASCIPCSIFMSAQGRPASATHFGRGDYWSIPPHIKEPLKDKWIDHVKDCYETGCKTTRLRFPGPGAPPPKNIPWLFLEALTFPDKFSQRIIRTLERITGQTDTSSSSQ